MGSLSALVALAFLSIAPPAAGPPGPTPPDVDAALAAAAGASRAGDYAGAEAGLLRLVAALEADDAPAAPRADWTRALLQLAQVEATLGRMAQSRGALDRLVAVEPDVAADPDLYSPRFRRELDQARARRAASPHHTLQVSSTEGPAAVRIDGQPVGLAPAEVRLPEGRYRVEVIAAQGARIAWVELGGDASVALGAPPVRDLPPVETSRLAAGPPPATLSATAPADAVHLDVEQAAPGGWMRPVALSCGGVAVASIGIATWQGIVAVDARNEANAMLLPNGSLKPGIDPSTYAAVADQFTAARRNAWIAAGSAVATGGAAVLLWVLAPTSLVTPAAGGLALAF